MNSPENTAAKMICKSIDALTREVYMLRKDILEGWKLNAEMAELDKGAEQIPPLPMIGETGTALLAEGKYFQL